MTDTIKGEVLVPASRFLPKCECEAIAQVHTTLPIYGISLILGIEVKCTECHTPYEQELPQGVEGIEHGKV